MRKNFKPRKTALLLFALSFSLWLGARSAKSQECGGTTGANDCSLSCCSNNGPCYSSPGALHIRVVLRAKL